MIPDRQPVQETLFLTLIIVRIIQNYGFSPKVGLVAHSDDDLPYLSGAKKDEIESEIRRFVDEGWGRVKGLMQDNIGDLHKVGLLVLRLERCSSANEIFCYPMFSSPRHW